MLKNGKSNDEIASEIIIKCNKILKKVNTVYSHYDKILEDIKISDYVEDFEEKFTNCKRSITVLI